MTKEEIALELTIEFKNLVHIETGANNALAVANFYNTILETIKIK